MMSDQGPIKFTATDADGRTASYAYPNHWMREHNCEPERLVIGPERNHINIMIDLIECMVGPFGILYVLTVPRHDHEPGRYQLAAPCEKATLLSFLSDYREFFELDGRHHLWIFGLGDQSQLVYDNHNVIYAYGPLDQFQAELTRNGFTEGDVSYPAPHSHHYNVQFDDDEDRLLSSREWKWFPLVDEHDDP